jgi:hypothetical protein
MSACAQFSEALLARCDGARRSEAWRRTRTADGRASRGSIAHKAAAAALPCGSSCSLPPVAGGLTPHAQRRMRRLDGPRVDSRLRRGDFARMPESPPSPSDVDGGAAAASGPNTSMIGNGAGERMDGSMESKRRPGTPYVLGGGSCTASRRFVLRIEGPRFSSRRSMSGDSPALESIDASDFKAAITGERPGGPLAGAPLSGPMRARIGRCPGSAKAPASMATPRKGLGP